MILRNLMMVLCITLISCTNQIEQDSAFDNVEIHIEQKELFESISYRVISNSYTNYVSGIKELKVSFNNLKKAGVELEIRPVWYDFKGKEVSSFFPLNSFFSLGGKENKVMNFKAPSRQANSLAITLSCVNPKCKSLQE